METDNERLNAITTAFGQGFRAGSVLGIELARLVLDWWEGTSGVSSLRKEDAMVAKAREIIGKEIK